MLQSFKCNRHVQPTKGHHKLDSAVKRIQIDAVSNCLPCQSLSMMLLQQSEQQIHLSVSYTVSTRLFTKGALGLLLGDAAVL